jgi:hypothetical protein
MNTLKNMEEQQNKLLDVNDVRKLKVLIYPHSERKNGKPVYKPPPPGDWGNLGAALPVRGRGRVQINNDRYVIHSTWNSTCHKNPGVVEFTKITTIFGERK